MRTPIAPATARWCKALAWTGDRTARDRRRQDRKYCRARVPASFRDQIRVEAAVRGSSVSIYECRPPWHPDLTEWSKLRVAQLRYSADTHHWSLYWADRNGRWHRYDDLEPGPVGKLLCEIEADPTCIFWG